MSTFLAQSHTSPLQLVRNVRTRWLSTTIGCFVLGLLWLPCAELQGFKLGNRECSGSPEGGVEFVWLRPSVCDLHVAIFDPRSVPIIGGDELPQGKQKVLTPSYSFGFRLFGGYLCPGNCFDGQIHYTHLHATDRKRLRDRGKGTVWITATSPKYAVNLTGDVAIKARSRFIYDTVDLQLARRCSWDWGIQFRQYLGLRFARIDQKFTIDYRAKAAEEQSVDNHLAIDRTAWGIGPELGLEARGELGCGCGLSARLVGALLAGSTDGHYHERDCLQLEGLTVDEPLSAGFAHRSLVFPFVQGRIGVYASYCYGPGIIFYGEFGYEMTSYVNALARTSFNDADGRGMETTHCYSFNLDGFYLLGRVTF